MKNIEIRNLLKKRRIFNYEVAQELGITEFTFCRWLRNEFSKERKELVLEAIKRLTVQSSEEDSVCNK